MTKRIIALGAVKRILLLGALAGSLAGLMMAGVEMIYGWASPVHSVWDAPMAIWAYVGGLNHFGHPANHIGSIVLGIGGHMMNAIFVAIVFVALMRILKDPPGAVALVLGIAYGLGLWALQRYVTLPIRKPEDTLFTTGTVSPQWVWWLAHLALGTGMGLGYVLSRRRLAVALPGRVREMPAQPVNRKAA
jgi:uncharacterized membrane protein YagU involved in acid resistance